MPTTSTERTFVDSASFRSRAWSFYLGAVAVASTIYLACHFVGPHVLNDGPVFNALGASSIVAIALGLRAHRPSSSLAWTLIAVGQALFVGGDILAYNYKLFFGSELPFPSIADVLYLAVYPSLVAGLLILVHRRTPGRDWESVVDSVIIATGVGVLSWVFLMAPQAHAEMSGLAKLTSLAYPLMDILLLSVTVRLAVAVGRREPAFYFLVGAGVSLFVTDSVYGWLLLHGGYATGGLLDAGWLAFYALFGAGALHPSMRSLTERSAPRELKVARSRVGRARLALLAAATLVAPAAELVQYDLGNPYDVSVLVGCTVLVTLLVVLRLAGLVHQHERTAAREAALRHAGSALATATSPKAIYAAALQAARTLADDERHIRLWIDGVRRGELVEVGETGNVDADGPGLVVGMLPSAIRERLAQRRSVEFDTSAIEASRRIVFGASASVFVAPLVVQNELHALLSVAGERELPLATEEGLDRLALQVSLALESAQLTEELLRQEGEARFRSLVQNSSDLIAVIEPNTTIGYVSPSVERILGYQPDELAGTSFAELVHAEDRTPLRGFLSALIGAQNPGMIELRMRRSDGAVVTIEARCTDLLQDTAVAGIVINARDVGERKAFERELSHQAFHDALTGLPNRALFGDRVAHALTRQERKARPIAVLFLDLDDFKTVNDSLGHAAGDTLLRYVAERIVGCLRVPDTAARMGGDEFAVLLEDVGDMSEASEVAERIILDLKAPFALEGKEVYVHASVGIALGNADRGGPTNPEELLRNADVAMYIAKEKGKSRWELFEPAMHETVLERLDLKAGLQRALERGEFVLHYQPIVVLDTGQVEGVEALVRWQHPERGMVPPGDFIPIAEDTGLIVPLGQWVLQEACRHGRELHDRFPLDPALTMSVNLSARQLQRPEIVREVREALEVSGFAAESLILEITETVMMDDMDLAVARMNELKQLGIKLAVDDFGSGYSSLNYIRHFPIDVLKVDKSFIDVVSDGNDQSAVTAKIIELAGILQLRPVAEGIERPEQLEQLLELQCQSGQGYLFARPLTPLGIEDFVTQLQADAAPAA